MHAIATESKPVSIVMSSDRVITLEDPRGKARLVLFGVMTLLVVTASFACSAEESPPAGMKEYFEGLESIHQRANQDLDSHIADVTRTLESVTADTPESVGIDLLLDSSRASKEILERTSDDLRALYSPTEVGAAHDLAIAAYVDAAEVLNRFIQNVEETAQIASLQWAAIEFFSIMEQLGEKEMNACSELQNLAQTYDINADKVCKNALLPPNGVPTSSL